MTMLVIEALHLSRADVTTSERCWLECTLYVTTVICVLLDVVSLYRVVVRVLRKISASVALYIYGLKVVLNLPVGGSANVSLTVVS
jgi:hypothetical protein